MTDFALDLAFDTDDPEFCRGFEAANTWRSVRLFAFGAARGPQLVRIVHTTNAEMMLRIAESFDLDVRSDEVGDGWMNVTFTRRDSDNSRSTEPLPSGSVSNR